jgi:DNA repair protein RadA/Sms
VTLEGRRPLVTEVQALVTRSAHGGSPRRAVSNLDSARVAMLLAVLARQTRLSFAEQEVYAATVGGITAGEPAADLAVALALASAAKEEPLPATCCAIGEVSLSGDVRRVPALARRLAEAARLGFTAALVPAGQAAEQPGVAGIRAVAVATLDEALRAVGRLGTEGAAVRRARLHSVGTGPN